MTSLTRKGKIGEEVVMDVYEERPDAVKELLEPDEGWWAAVLADEPKIEQQDNSDDYDISEKPHPCESKNPESTVNWEKIKDIFSKDEIVELEVVGFNKGGILVLGDELHGFVPASHLIELPANIDEEDREAYFSGYLGKMIAVKVIECEPEKDRIVFSERAALAKEGQRKHLLSSLVEGDCIEGVVTNVTSFGAFVDLGGLEGLIHVSELSWGRVEDPNEIVKVGENVKVMILQVLEAKGRIALSLKRLCENPWKVVAEQLSSGDTTEATISSIVKYGAFARLEAGIEGLIHISSMDFPEDCQKIDDFLYEGQPVKVSVLNLDPKKRRLGLRLERYEY